MLCQASMEMLSDVLAIRE